MLKKAGETPIVIVTQKQKDVPQPVVHKPASSVLQQPVVTADKKHDAGVEANEAKHGAAKAVAQQGFTDVDKRTVQGSTVFSARMGSVAGAGAGEPFKALASFIGDTIGAARADPKQLAAIATGDAKAANNYRPDLFQKPMDRVWKHLHSDVVIERVARDPFLKAPNADGAPLHRTAGCPVTTMSAANLKKKYPALQVIERGPHELEIANPKRAHQRVKIVLPHADVYAEATATWADSKQTIKLTGPAAANGVGQVVETSKWEDEPMQWSAPFDAWVDAWLALLASSSSESGPVRPGR